MLTIRFGRTLQPGDLGYDEELTLPQVGWPGITPEEDGTHLGTIDGLPYRNIGAVDGLQNWERKLPSVKVIADYMHKDRDGRCPLNDVLDMIQAIPLTKNELFNDRRQFLLYWSKRAIATFGDEAMIQWSY